MENKMRIYIYIYIVLFCAILLIPILAVNRVQGRTSVTELRVLEKFPQIFDENGLSESLKEDYEAWLDDNIGFRAEMVKLTANIKLKLFHQSTGDKVELGREDWYFYTPQNNIELATGEYVLSEETLEKLAEQEQRISDWYAAQGIKYILVLTPAKASIYPEYLLGGDYGVRTTLVNQAEEYLREHTNVHIVNTKQAVLADKENHQLFLKTDPHWTQAGAWAAYQAIEKGLNDYGVSTKDFQVEFDFEQITGGFSAMLGCAGILDDEVVPAVVWDAQAEEVDSGSLFEAIKEFPTDSPELPQRFSIFQNPEAENGTLLIYADSQWDAMRNLPKYLGESFQTVVTMRNNKKINLDLDELVKPDVVIYGYSESLLGRLNLGEVPLVAKSLEGRQEKTMITREEYGEWIGNHGIYIERCNSFEPGNYEPGVEPYLEIGSNEEEISITGWAPDFSMGSPLQGLYLRVGDILIDCDYGKEKPWVAEHYKNDDFLMSGFTVTFPRSYLQNGKVQEISFIGVSADGELYAPVTYQLHFIAQEADEKKAEGQAVSLPDLPFKSMISREEYGQWIGNHGIHIEKFNDYKPDAHSTELEIDPGEKEVSISGWAPDFSQGVPLKELYLTVGETVLKCGYGTEKPWVAETYQNDALLDCGFEIKFPVSYLKDGDVSEISFVGVSADGQYLYMPVTFRIVPISDDC